MHKRILIVDDYQSMCNSLALLLRGEGHCVDAITNSRKAESLIKKNRYDICFFDYKMNGLNGIDLLKITKDVNSRCLVFIISGMVDNIDKSCSELADGIISKPFGIEVLLQRIAAIA